ncbi:MAG: CDP-diacylglycerol--glycerol-3-phosphate 3-phosphatidyltransferase [Proteobacteria bacterium]|nr:CDP-diacylglycerol--glycerol-3-phosphate 3-phosphatidyltransferase [Pseudomonadota bacterium]
MSIYRLKPAFQSLLRPLVGALARAGIRANQVTLAACLVSIGVGALLVLHPGQATLFVLVPTWMLLRMAMNAIDGMLAREFAQKTPLGAYLNEISDVLSDAALYLPFGLIAGSNMTAVAVVIVLAATSELAGAVAVMTGASRRYDGPMGKSDRAFVFGLLGLLVALGVPLAAWLNWVWAAVAALTALTIANRIRGGLREISR